MSSEDHYDLKFYELFYKARREGKLDEFKAQLHAHTVLCELIEQEEHEDYLDEVEFNALDYREDER